MNEKYPLDSEVLGLNWIGRKETGSGGLYCMYCNSCGRQNINCPPSNKTTPRCSDCRKKKKRSSADLPVLSHGAWYLQLNCNRDGWHTVTSPPTPLDRIALVNTSSIIRTIMIGTACMNHCAAATNLDPTIRPQPVPAPDTAVSGDDLLMYHLSPQTR